MPSSADDCPAPGELALASEAPRSTRGFWSSIAWIAVVEVVVLLALAGVFIAYLNWSSEASFAEFLSAGEASSSSPLSAVKAPCDGGA